MKNINTYYIHMDHYHDHLSCQAEIQPRKGYYLPQHNEVLTIVFVHLSCVLIFGSLLVVDNRF